MPIDHYVPINVGSRVSYEDASNPRKEGAVEDVIPAGDFASIQYRVRWEDGSSVTSDLRQAGWHLLADLPGSIFDGAEVISSYTQAQAIEDGNLVPLGFYGDDLPTEAGFTAPVLLTRALFNLVSPTPREIQAGQSLRGRLWDVLSMGRFAIKRAPDDGSELDYQVSFANLGRGRADSGRKTKRLRLVAGPDDHGALCIVIGFPEDF